MYTSYMTLWQKGVDTVSRSLAKKRQAVYEFLRRPLAYDKGENYEHFLKPSVSLDYAYIIIPKYFFVNTFL